MKQAWIEPGTFTAAMWLALAPLAAHANCTHNWMQCPVSSSLQVNSFTIQAAQVINKITGARNAATAGLQHHTMTVQQAKDVLANTDLGRAEWDLARSVCKADQHGNCDNDFDSRKAFALLDMARRAVK